MPFALLGSYLKSTLRSISRRKAYSFINMAGFAIGLACSFTLLLYAAHEAGYDRHYAHAARIFRITTHGREGDERMASTPYNLAPLVGEQVPDVTDIARIRIDEASIRSGADFFHEKRVAYADASFLRIFTIRFLHGDGETALSDPNSIVLTESSARKYFGAENPMGKILTLRKKHPRFYQLKVTGVIEDIPENSHFKLDFIVPIAGVYWGYEDIDRTRAYPSFESWSCPMFYTYVLVRDAAEPTSIERMLDGIVRGSIGEDFSFRFRLQRLRAIHLSGGIYTDDIEEQQNARTMYLFLAVALLVLIAAMMNYMLLSTAESAERAKEVGIRKVLGAGRGNVVAQTLGESVALALLSLPAALALVKLFLFRLDRMTGPEHSPDLSIGWPALLAFGAITSLAGLLSGVYISLHLSRFRPLDVLKSGICSGTGRPIFRRALILLQLIIFAVLSVSSILVFGQIRYAKDNEVLGFDKENVLSIHVTAETFRPVYDAFRNEIEKSPHILRVSASFATPPANNASLTMSPKTELLDEESISLSMADAARGNYDEEKYDILLYNIVDYDYFETLSIPIVSGRSFSRSSPGDDRAIMVNELFVEKRGPAEPVGEEIVLLGEKHRIIGVFGNFHTESLHIRNRPMYVKLGTRYMRQVVVALERGSVEAALPFLEETWRKHCPDAPFVYTFLSESLDRMYRAEDLIGRLIGSFTALAISIAALGLFGLSMFSAERRAGEICIRKVLGASAASITRLLTREYLVLALLANAAAWPIAWLAVSRWLQDFAYKRSIGYEAFAATGALTVAITLSSVIFQVTRAARTNPTDVLRYE